MFLFSSFSNTNLDYCLRQWSGEIFSGRHAALTDWQVSQINIYVNKKTKAAATDASTAARVAKIELQSNAISVQMADATRQTDILPAQLSQRERKTHSFPAVCEAAGQHCSLHLLGLQHTASWVFNSPSPATPPPAQLGSAGPGAPRPPLRQTGHGFGPPLLQQIKST